MVEVSDPLNPMNGRWASENAEILAISPLTTFHSLQESHENARLAGGLMQIDASRIISRFAFTSSSIARLLTQLAEIGLSDFPATTREVFLSVRQCAASGNLAARESANR